MEIKPHKKLITKQWWILLTISVFIVISGIVLQVLISLEDDVTSGEVAVILWPVVFGTLILMWVIAAPIIVLWIHNLSYRIEDDRVTIHKGILTKMQQNIPYRAITDFVLHRSLYDRFLGIGSICIQTAGQTQTATGYEGKMAGLIDFQDMHQQLRDTLKTLHPRAEAVTVAEKVPSFSGEDKLELILEELKAIRHVLEKK